jgi:hypothetical protein
MNSHPRLNAQKALRCIGPLVLPIEPEVVALACGVHAVRPSAGSHALCRLTFDAEKAVIEYHPACWPGRRRTAIAHQLGHYFEVGTVSINEISCGAQEFRRFTDMSGSEKILTREDRANDFADFLLMPFGYFEEFTYGREPGIRVLLEIFDYFGAAKHSTIRRYVASQTVPLAIILEDPRGGLNICRNPQFQQAGESSPVQKQSIILSNGWQLTVLRA